MIKRFKSSELGETAGRRVGHDFQAEYAKCGKQPDLIVFLIFQEKKNSKLASKATCRVCKGKIEQGELRLALMLQDDEGYKSTNWTHFDCFWKHRVRLLIQTKNNDVIPFLNKPKQRKQKNWREFTRFSAFPN